MRCSQGHRTVRIRGSNRESIHHFIAWQPCGGDQPGRQSASAMIYLLALFLKWIARALIPTLLLLVLGVVVMLGIWFLVLRPRKISAWKGWLAVGLITIAFGGWRSVEVWREFSRPELHMFRTYVADPIPAEVQGLAPASAAPVMFHDGAYISFHAPPEVVDRLTHHALPGSKTLEVVVEMKRQSSRNTADRIVLAGPDGQSYLKVDVDWVAKESSSESQWVRGEVENFHRNHKVNSYVYLKAGEWGSFASVVHYEPNSSNVTILQNLERRR
jgi:hypothetical protein